MTEKTSALIKKMSWPKRWDQALPFLFIAYLFGTFLWQLSNFNKLTAWVDRTDRILWNLKEADNYLVEMHNDLRGYQISERRVYLQNYRKSMTALTGNLNMVRAEALNAKGAVILNDFEEGLENWFEFADTIIWRELRGQETEGVVKRGEGTAIIRGLREKITTLMKIEMEDRRLRKERLEETTRLFYLISSLGMIAISFFFIVNWFQNRKTAQHLQRTQDKYRSVAESAKLAEERFRGLLESAHDLIMIIDDKGVIQFVNEQLARTFAYTRDELIGKEMEILVPERYRKLHVVQRRNYMKHPVARPMGMGMELFGRRRDGSEIPVEITLSPFRSQNFFQVAAIIRDISFRKQIEEKQKWMAEIGSVLSQSLEPVDVLKKLGEFCASKCSDWTVIVPNEGDASVTIRSQVAQRAVQSKTPVYTAKEVIRKQYIERLEEKGPILRQNISQQDLRKVGLDERDIENIFHLGIKSAMIFLLKARERVLGGIVLVSSHTNYTKEEFDFARVLVDRAALVLDNAILYQTSQRLSKTQEEMMRVVSHDLKNPLSSLKLNLQVLERHFGKVPQNEKIFHRIRAMDRITDQAVKLIKDLLDTAKLETGGLELDKTELDPQHILHETEALFSSLAEEKGIDLTFRTAGDGLVQVDHQRILQVISNLLGNALKFTPRGGRIEVKFDTNEKGVSFSISDNGAGIPPEKMRYLFQKYWKDEQTGAHNLGLGLAIAKGIVIAHGGEIWAESEVGKGTTFHFTLPRAYRDDKNRGELTRPPVS